MSRYARTIFMAVSAVCGGIWSASVRFPIHWHGLFQPMNQRHNRYSAMFVENNTIRNVDKNNRCEKKHARTIAISQKPTPINKRPNLTPINGSVIPRILLSPNALNIFATPVLARIAPALIKKYIISRLP